MSGRKTDTTELEMTVVPAVPKKRGRPKHEAAEKQDSNTAPAAKNAQSALTEQPKKRGRPKHEAADTAAEKQNSNAAPAAKNAQSALTEQPKKRGRPKRDTAADTAATAKNGKPTETAKSEKSEQPKKSNAAKSDKTEAAKLSEKTEPKKPKRQRRQPKNQDITPETSSKTPQVLKLVSKGNDMVNPTIMAGKSSIPRKLRGLEPLTKIMRREQEEIFGTDSEAETFNLTALVIDDTAAEILRRFNACDCELCVETLSRLTADEVPARFAKLKRRAVERNLAEVEELKTPLRKTVTASMIRLVIKNKKRSYHE